MMNIKYPLSKLLFLAKSSSLVFALGFAFAGLYQPPGLYMQPPGLSTQPPGLIFSQPPGLISAQPPGLI